MSELALFWKTGPAVRAERGVGYTAFALFSPTHIFWLLLTAALCLTLGFWYRRAGPRARQRLLCGLTVFLLLDEVLKYAVTLATGQWEWAFLPLHLCSLNIFVCLFNTLRPSRNAQEILYGLCLPGAALALLSPSWQPLPLWNIMHLHSGTVHAALFLYPILLLAGGFRPDLRRIPVVFAFLLGVSVPIYAVNKALGTNFLFLNGAGENALTRALAALLGEPYYLLGFPVLILLILLLLYLPWYGVRMLRAGRT